MAFYKRSLIIIALLTLALSTSLPAQQINFKLGFLMPSQGSDLWDDNLYNLTFEKADFNDLTFAIEYQQQIHQHFGFYFEGSWYNQSVTADYRDYEYDNGDPITQTLSLSMTALEGGVKFNILPYRQRFSPYVGAGVGLYLWDYEQSGDFIDFTNMDIYEGLSDQQTASIGVHVKGGLSWHFSRDFGLLIEAKYHWARGDLGYYFEGFEPFDLSGLSLLAGLQFYF